MSDITRDDLSHYAERLLLRALGFSQGHIELLELDVRVREEFDRLARQWLQERAELTESYVEGYLGGSGLMLDYVPDEPGKRFYVIPADWLEAEDAD